MSLTIEWRLPDKILARARWNQTSEAEQKAQPHNTFNTATWEWISRHFKCQQRSEMDFWSNSAMDYHGLNNKVAPYRANFKIDRAYQQTNYVLLLGFLQVSLSKQHAQSWGSCTNKKDLTLGEWIFFWGREAISFGIPVTRGCAREIAVMV